MAQLKLIINPDTSKIPDAVKEIQSEFNKLSNIEITVDSSGLQAVKNLSAELTKATQVASQLSKATSGFNGTEGFTRVANDLAQTYGKLEKVVYSFSEGQKEASSAVATYTDGIGRAINVLLKFDKDQNAITNSVMKTSESLKEQEKAAQKAAEQEQRDLERTSAQAQTLSTNFSNITRRINELEEHYPASTFSSLSGEIGNARTRLEGLNAQFKNGEITNADYIAGVKFIGSEYQSLNGKLSVILETTQRLSMTEAEQAEYLEREMAKEAAAIDKAQSSAVSLETQYSKLSQSIVKLSENYPAGTFDDLNHRLEEARFQLDTTVRAFESGTIGSQEFMERIQAASGTLQSLSSELVHTQENTERLPITMEQAQASANNLERSFSALARSIANASEKYPADTFNTFSTSLTAARNELTTLNAQWQAGEITEQQYTNGIVNLLQTLGLLNTQFTTTKESTNQLSMTVEQARQKVVSLDTQYANLLRTIKGLKAQYPAGTFDELERQVREAHEELQRLDSTTSTYTADVSRLGETLNSSKARLANIREETQKLDKVTESLWTNIQKFARWYVIGNVFTKILSSFKEAFSVMKDVDSELANIQKVTDRTDAEMQKLAKSAYSVASSYGVAATDYLQSVSTFAKAGYDELSESLAELATKTQLVGDVTSDIANQFLISVDAAWKMNGNVAMLSKTLDAANTIENNYATSIQKLAEGMPIVASVAAQAGMSVEETMAAIGTITSVTQESGTKAATALRALLLNLIGAAGEYEDGIEVTEESIKSLNDVLNVYAADAMKAAEAAGTVINPMAAIAALAEASEKGALNQAKLFEMLSSLGGKLRTNQLTALVTNFEMFNEQLEMAGGAAGSADKEIERMLGTWKFKTNILKNTWTEFIQKTIQTDFVKGIVDAGTAIIDFSDNLGIAIPAALGFWNILKNWKPLLKDIKNALNGLETSSALAGGAISLVAIAVSTLIMGIKQYQEHLREVASESLDVAQKANIANDSIYDSYTAMENATAGTEEFNTAAKKLADTLGTTLPDNAQNSIDKLKELTEEQLKTAASSASVAVANAEKAFLSNSGNVSIPEIVGNGTHSGLNARITELMSAVAVTGFSPNSNQAIYTPISKSVEGIKEYYETLLDVKKLIEEEFRETDDKKLLNSATYKRVSKAIDSMTESYETYVAAVDESNLAEARLMVADFAKEVGTVTPAALAAFGASINANAEYTDDFKAVVFEVARESFPQFSQAAKEAEETLDDASESVNALEAKLKSFSESTNAADEAIGGVVEALDKFGVGSYEVYEAMLALEEAIPGSTAQLYDFETGALNVEAALLADKYSFLDLVDASKQVSFQKAIDELDSLKAAAMEAFITTKMAKGAFAATYMDVGAPIPVAKQVALAKAEIEAEMAAWSSLVTSLRSRSSYAPPKTTTTGTGKGNSGSTSSKSEKTPEEIELEAKEQTVKLLKSELTLLEKSNADTDSRVAKMREIQTALHDEAEYMRSIGADQAEINGLSAEWWDYQKEIEELLKDTTDHLKKYEDTISALETHLELTEKQGASAEEQIETYREIQNQLHQEAEYLRSIQASQEEIDKLSIRWWEIEEKIKGIQDDIAKTQQDLFDSLKSTVDEYYDKVVSDKEKELELDKKILAVQKAQEALANAQAEHKVRYYNAALGAWEWTGDAQTIKSAQESLKSAQDALNEYNTAQAQSEFKSAWDYVADQIKDGAMTFKEAYDYMYAEMKKIQDKYGVNLGLVLEDSIGGFKDINGGIGELSKEVSESLIGTVGLMMKHLEDLESATDDLKAAWDEAAEKVKSGELPIDSAFAYLKEKAREIADKYGIDMTEALDTAIAGFDKTSGGIDELWKQVVITLMRANSVNWYNADEVGKEYLHAQNQILGKAIGATYESGNGYWVDEKGYRIYDPKDGVPSESIPKTSASSGSNSSSGGSEDAGRNNSIIERMQENAAKWWTSDDETKAKLAAQNESLGKMIGATKDVNGVWWDKDGYRLFDSGGVLKGVGGIKATTEDEMILPPDITKQLLSPISDRVVANRLDIMRQCLGVESSKTAGAYSDYSVGTQHNGDIYNMNGYSISEKQAKSMSVYDFARLAKGLGISNHRN